MDFIPMDDIKDDPDAIVARLRQAAGVEDEGTDRERELTEKVTELRDLVDDLELARRANDRSLSEEADLPWHRKVTRRLRGEGSPHNGKR